MLHVFVGACLQDEQGCRNQAYYLAPIGEREVYNKANLANHERGHLIPGDRLPMFDLQIPEGPLRVAVQLCRELQFPDHWRVVSEAAAGLFVYITHLIEDEPHRPGRRESTLDCRRERRPSMLIDPSGLVIDETVSEDACRMRAEIDTNAVSNWYLSQQRTDWTRWVSATE